MCFPGKSGGQCASDTSAVSAGMTLASSDVVAMTPGVPTPGAVSVVPMRSMSPRMAVVRSSSPEHGGSGERNTTHTPFVCPRRRVETPMVSARSRRSTVSHVQHGGPQNGGSLTISPTSWTRRLQSTPTTPSYTPMPRSPESDARTEVDRQSVASARIVDVPRSSPSRSVMHDRRSELGSAPEYNCVLMKTRAEDPSRIPAKGPSRQSPRQRSPRQSPMVEPRFVGLNSCMVADSISETSVRTLDSVRPDRAKSPSASVPPPPFIAAVAQRQNTPLHSPKAANGLSRTEQVSSADSRTMSNGMATENHSVPMDSSRGDAARTISKGSTWTVPESRTLPVENQTHAMSTQGDSQVCMAAVEQQAMMVQSDSLSTNAGSMSLGPASGHLATQYIAAPDSVGANTTKTSGSVSVGPPPPPPTPRYYAADKAGKSASVVKTNGNMSVPHPRLVTAEKPLGVVLAPAADCNQNSCSPTLQTNGASVTVPAEALGPCSPPTPSEITVNSNGSARVQPQAPNTSRDAPQEPLPLTFMPLESPNVQASFADANMSFMGSTSSPPRAPYRETLPSSPVEQKASYFAHNHPSSRRASPRLHVRRTVNISPMGEKPVQRRSSNALGAVFGEPAGVSIRTAADDRRGEREREGRKKVVAARSWSPPHGVSGHRSPANSLLAPPGPDSKARDRSTRRPPPSEVWTHPYLGGSSLMGPSGVCRVAPARGSGNTCGIADLQVGCGKPDPTQPMVRSQLIAELGLSQRTTMTPLKGGGQNEGIWMVEDGMKSYVLKLVKHQLPHQSATSDTDRLLRLASEHPSIIEDPALAFPLKMFHCKGPTGTHAHDLMVMRKASGRALTEYIALKWANGDGAPLVMDLLEKVGGFLADFHLRYGQKQHCDFHPTNIFYDEATGRLTMIDVGSIGAHACAADIDHFIAGLGIMSRCFGPQFHADGMFHFRAGYTMSAMR